MNSDELLIRNESDHSLEAWRTNEKYALELLQIAGSLRFDRAIDLIFFRKEIYDARTSEIMAAHIASTKYAPQAIEVSVSLDIARSIATNPDFKPCKIDIGKLASEWYAEKTDDTDIPTFISGKLNEIANSDTEILEPKDIVLYGFGRIGRIAARRIISMTGKGEQLRLKAIVLRPKLKDRAEELSKRAALLKEDTVHGTYHGSVEVSVEDSELIVNGNRVKIIFAGQPEDIDYTQYGIQNALVIDNTGVWRDHEGLSRHLRPGVSQVMLTAPGNGVPNIVYGVNHTDLDLEKETVFSAASCTTNAIVPILKVVDGAYNIQKGHIETIHAYTNDQNLVDNFHKKPRRGRGAATNMVLTSTGAAKAVAKVIPHLKGKLTGNAVRVPTPNVSLAIMSLTFDKTTTLTELSALLKDACLNSDYFEQIHYSEDKEYVSSQAVGMTTTSVLDVPSMILSDDGKTATIYAWYDNEFGYTCQVLRLAKYVAKVRRPHYY